MNTGEIVCILDAFDECADDERRKLASALRNFYGPGNDTKTACQLEISRDKPPFWQNRARFPAYRNSGSVYHPS
jgi:hypothetical protein